MTKLKDWAKEIFKKNSFNMIDVSSKKETFRRALASGKIYVGKEVFNLIKNKEMPKGDPITLAEVSAILGVKKTSELIPLCHPLPIDHTATKIIMHEDDGSLEVFCVVSAIAKTGVEMVISIGFFMNFFAIVFTSGGIVAENNHEFLLFGVWVNMSLISS